MLFQLKSNPGVMCSVYKDEYMGDSGWCTVRMYPASNIPNGVPIGCEYKEPKAVFDEVWEPASPRSIQTDHKTVNDQTESEQLKKEKKHSQELFDKLAQVTSLATAFVGDLFKIPCPRDTNGDGVCGRKNCSICGENGKLFELINKFRTELTQIVTRGM